MARKASPDIRPFTRQFYRGTKRYLALGFVQTIIMTAVNLLISWLLQQMIDLAGGVDTGFTLTGLILLACLFVGMILICYVLEHMGRPRFISRGMAQYREYACERLSKKSIAAFSRENTSTYISALTNDANAIENGYLASTFLIADHLLLGIGALVMMCLYSPLLTGLSIAIALLPLAASIISGGLVAGAETRLSDANERYTATVRDSLAGFPVIKAFRAEKEMLALYSRQVQGLAAAVCHRRRMGVLVEMLSMTAGVILQIGISLIGVYLVLSGHDGLTAGTVLIFVQLLNYVIQPLGVIPQELAKRTAGKALIAKLAEALDKSVREEGSVTAPTLTEGITVQNLTFCYEEGNPALNDVNLRIPAGQSVAIVGASGCGKSTLLNLLMGASHDYTGVIRYDGNEICDIRSEALYDLVGLIAQNVFIFNASIRDNITMFRDFPQDALDRAIELSGLNALIAQRGEDYLCGENGSGLSGGEKQRISIARSLLRRTPCLLVDEATAALDAATAHQVSSAILDLQGLTRIVVTHSLEEALLRRYDTIVAMKAGQVVETGSFDELMARKEYFYSLYTISQ